MSDTYGAQPPAGPPQGVPNDLAAQWKGWMDNPQNKASLIQFGLALSQPTALGQNTMGHIGEAIGAGGEAADRVSASQRADEEAQRKRDETDSRTESRINAASNAEVRANAAALNARSTADQVDSRIQLRRSQALFADSHAKQMDSTVRMLEMRIAAFPDDAQAKLELAQAKTLKAQADTDLAIARAGVVEQDSGTRKQNADTRATDVASKVGTREANTGIAQQNADTRRDLGGRRADTAQQRADSTAAGINLGASVRDRRAYDQFVAQTRANDNNAILMNPKAVQTPIPSFQEWRTSRSSAPAASAFPPPAPAPATTPTPVPTPALNTAPGTPSKFFKVAPGDVAKYPDAKQAPDGNYYIQR